MTNFLKKIFLTSLVLLSVIYSFGQGVRSNSSSKVFPLTPTEAAQRWSEFSKTRPVSDYCFSFTLEHKPRKGESEFYDGLIWGTSGDISVANTRISLKKRDFELQTNILILGNLGNPNVYKYSNNAIKKLEYTEWFAPILDGTIYSPFDILMPFKTWESSYFGPGRVSRAVHFYDLKAPENFKGANISKIRVALSREFNAPFQNEYFDKNNEVTRVLSLGSVKKFDEKWIVKELEMFDKNSRDKDTIKIVSAKFLGKFPDGIFEVKNLSKKFEEPKDLESL